MSANQRDTKGKTKDGTMSKEQDFERFYREHYDALFYYALRLVDEGEACRDIVSEALEQIWTKIDVIDPEKMKNFAYSTVHHICVDHVRHQMAASRYVAFYLQLYSRQVNDDEWEEHERLINTVVGLMDKLSPRTRYVLEQCYFHRKRYAEVASEMGITISGVKKHIVTALKTLRAEMAKKY